MNPPSSPVRGDYTLKDYIDWHIRRQPHRKEQLLRAYDRLEEDCYVIHHIQKWKDNADMWRSLGVPPGLGQQLAEDASRFAREYEQDCANPPVLTIRESPRKQGAWKQPSQQPQSHRQVLQSIECDSGSYNNEEETQGYEVSDLGGEDLEDSQIFISE